MTKKMAAAAPRPLHETDLTDRDGATLPLAVIERAAIENALLREPTTSAAARALGVGRSTLYRKLAEYAR